MKQAPYIAILRVLHLTTHYSMQECASCNISSGYKTTDHMHNSIHGCLSVCWLDVHCTCDHVSAFLDKTRSVFIRMGPYLECEFLVAYARLQQSFFQTHASNIQI